MARKKTIAKVRIHMSTLKKLAERCREGSSEVELVCSVRSGRILAYPDGTSGISPGSWCLLYDSLYPMWEDGRFVGTMHDGELKNYSGVFCVESSLSDDLMEKILYEIVVVPDGEPEDLSEVVRR